MLTKPTPEFTRCAPDDPEVPKGDAWYCEVRPQRNGQGFLVECRLRVLGWVRSKAGELRPKTAFGVVKDLAAFGPHPDHLLSGHAFVELHDDGQTRRWWSPVAKDVTDDAAMKAYVRTMYRHATDPVLASRLRLKK